MKKKPTRAQQMAEQYAGKLEDLDSKMKKPRAIKLADTQTLEQKEKLKKAREKLATFKDLLS